MMYVKKVRGEPWVTTGDRTPPWYERNWPFSGHAEQEFEPLDPSDADSILRSEKTVQIVNPSDADAKLRAEQQFCQVDPFAWMSKPWVPSLRVDLATLKVAVKYTGFANNSSEWKACFRQQVLVHYNDEWVLLFAPALENSIRKRMPEIDQMTDLSNAANPMYLKLNRKNAMDYIETLRHVRQLSPSQDLDEIEKIAKNHSKLTQELLNLGELLIAWGVPNSPLWPELTNDFKDCEALVPYLVDRRILDAGGSHPSHAPADSRFILLAKKWLELQRNQGGPATDKQRNFVAAVAKNILGVRPADLVGAMPEWKFDPDSCAKTAAKRLNEWLEKFNQQWRVDPTNAGRCRIVGASSFAAKTARRKV